MYADATDDGPQTPLPVALDHESARVTRFLTIKMGVLALYDASAALAGAEDEISEAHGLVVVRYAGDTHGRQDLSPRAHDQSRITPTMLGSQSASSA